MRLWHYTIFPTLCRILEAGEIKTNSFHNKDAPVVCLSSNPFWEEGVRKSIRDPETGEITGLLSRDELFRKGCAPVRIEIKIESGVTPHPWIKHHRKKSIQAEIAEQLEANTTKWGANPEEWWVAYHNIPLSSCFYPIEIWNGAGWRWELKQRD